MANKLNAAQEAVLEEELNVDPDSLLGKWRAKAYNQNADKQWLQKFWSNYFAIEKNIYELLLMNPDEEVKGTVKELADKYNISVEVMVGFLDGINDSLKVKNPIETMTEDTVVSLAFDKELLYKNMQHKLFLEQRKSHTIIKPKKIGRNDPCPCGSGKKYKYCCGRNVK